MPMFVLNRTHCLNSTQGVAINFEKGVPVFAPEFMRQEIENLGGEETGEGAVAPNPVIEPEGADRKKLLDAAFTQLAMLPAVDPDKAPLVADVNALLPFKISAAERDTAWAAFKAG